jgi:MFS transporter, DHA1 family, inner membrane transport protein
MPRLLVLFSLVNLVIGTGVFVIGGILAPIAEALNISVPAAGQAMTAYAVSTALLSPMLLLATGRWPRRHVLLLGLTLFTLGNAVCALAPNLPVLLAGRVLMGLGAIFPPVAAGIVVALVQPARRGQALSLVFLGISLSYVIGVPLGAWLGFTYDWHTPLWAITVASALALAVVALWVPREINAPGASFQGLGALLRRPAVLSVLGLTLIYFSAIFVVFSYIGPVLQALSPMSGTRLSVTLMLFGFSGVVGTLIGGRANDRFGTRRTLFVQLSLLAATMLVMPFTAGHWDVMVAVLLAWGTAGFGMMAPQQTRLAALAPTQAPLLLSLNSSMLYVGTAVGASLGGVLVPQLGFERLSWVGVLFALLGLVLLAAPSSRASAPAATPVR